MKKLIATCGMLVAAAILLDAPTAYAKPKKSMDERFKMLDKDSDGSLTEDEFVGKAAGDKADKAKARYKKLDKDSDSKLTLEEFKASGKKKKK